jgi:hypothetical protein
VSQSQHRNRNKGETPEKNWVHPGYTVWPVLPQAGWTPRARPFHPAAAGNNASEGRQNMAWLRWNTRRIVPSAQDSSAPYISSVPSFPSQSRPMPAVAHTCDLGHGEETNPTPDIAAAHLAALRRSSSPPSADAGARSPPDSAPLLCSRPNPTLKLRSRSASVIAAIRLVDFGVDCAFARVVCCDSAGRMTRRGMEVRPIRIWLPRSVIAQ